ncbi:MAG: peroxiredoxin [Rhodocyclaceae bacterium]|nr:peroxiredoxin [Rhodocyclaceae bacterium]MBK6907372.1 peroxiredoxin [Rhodocyclaceae bacterium]
MTAQNPDSSAVSLIGRPIPDFVAESTGGSTSRMALHGRPFVLYFYPKDNTPGCTTEALQFRDQFARFGQCNCTIFGISRDSLKSHKGFKEKLGLPFELIADTDETLCRMFDVIKTKNMYGKQVQGIERSTFLIDGAGVVRGEWRKVKADGHAQEVLCALSSL